ncbi:hypothetical protein IX318_000635 [Porphyromonas levii]|nr:hypothetical protein [Porphyromonas levii]MBR8714785.1 hypothetical protein [Porphyromonas levii]MBR8727251.1 hypothetical protein [Porphyromonas levii]MBR8735586.1 hypothetical protein [Porphyromonas levii]MBR8763097.1 hypothetical protein [Porphyromonas levii]
MRFGSHISKMSKRKLGAGFLLVLFSLYVGAIVANYHANLVNGILVAHSHAKLHNTHASDHHAPAELVVLHQLSHIQITGEIVPELEVEAPKEVGTLLLFDLESEEYSTIRDTYYRRGPPMAA